MNSGLIVCPTCLRGKQYNALGSVSTNGELYILRHKHGMTIIKAIEFTIMCACGFGTVVSSPSKQTYLIQ